MGMSASQAKLLCITARLNHLTARGQEVSDAKIRLAMSTQDVEERYTNALNETQLFINSQAFTVDGTKSKNERITLENLKAQGLLVSDGNKILGYTYKEVETGKTQEIITGYENDLTKPLYPTKETSETFRTPSKAVDKIGPADLTTMKGIVAGTGLGENDLKVVSYTTAIDGVEKDINAIKISSQAGFDAIINQMGTNPAALKQNYVFDLPEGQSIDLSGYNWHGIPAFQGIFDGNGVTFNNLKGDSGLFTDVYGIVKNVNLNNANITAETDVLGGIAGYLGDGGTVENCNVTNLNLTCTLKPGVDYPEGYKPERAGVGGIVGYNYGDIKNSSAQGSINVPYADESFGYIAGFIGVNINPSKGDSTVENCYSDVNIVLSGNTNYSNSINNFIGDDTHEATVKNSAALGSITTSSGAPINGTDLAGWGPCIESDVTNMMALDTRNNNNVLYWGNSTSPNYGSGSATKPPSMANAKETLSDGTSVNIWLQNGAEGYADQDQATATDNGLPALNLTKLQEDGLAKKVTKDVPDTDAEPIGYEQKPIKTVVPIKETILEEDGSFGGMSSAQLEKGLRDGTYTLCQKASPNSSQGMTIDGTDYELVSLSTVTCIIEKTDDNKLAIAEAKYKKEMEDLQSKDKTYEIDQKKIDTQYNAMLAEEESIKSALSKNIERSFKTFG